VRERLEKSLQMKAKDVGFELVKVVAPPVEAEPALLPTRSLSIVRQSTRTTPTCTIPPRIGEEQNRG
jgi:hypothetical protein